MTNTSSGVNACEGCDSTSSSIDFDIAIRVAAPGVCASPGSAMWNAKGTGSSSYNCVNNGTCERTGQDSCQSIEDGKEERRRQGMAIVGRVECLNWPDLHASCETPASNKDMKTLICRTIDTAFQHTRILQGRYGTFQCPMTR